MVKFIAGFLLAESQNVIFCFFLIKMCHTAQQNCTKYQMFNSSNGRRYWWWMMPEVLKKLTCPMYGHHWGLKSKV